LPAEWGEIEKTPNAPQRIHAASGNKVGAIDFSLVPEKDAKTKSFAFAGSEAEVAVEIASIRGEPGKGPPHSLFISLDLGERRVRHQNKIGVSGMKVRLMTDLIDKHGTTGTSDIGPAMDSGSKHEVVKEELAFAVKKLEQAGSAIRTLERVFFIDQNHW